MSGKWWFLLAAGIVLMGTFLFVVLFAAGAKYEASSGDSVAMKGKADRAAQRVDLSRIAEEARAEAITLAPPAVVDAPPPPPARSSDIRDPFASATPKYFHYRGAANEDALEGQANKQKDVGRLSGRKGKEMAEFESRRGRLADRELAIGSKGYLDADKTIAVETGVHRVTLAKSEEKSELKEKDRRKSPKKRTQASRDEADEPDDSSRGEGERKPASFLPRTCYFENTYLGGNAAYAERLRRLDDALGGQIRPHHEARLPPQPFDAPSEEGLSLTATLDRSWLDQPGKVILQVGLQGSHRFGWRRPPLDVVLVIDQPVVAHPRDIPAAIEALRKRLGPRDRMGIVLTAPTPLVISAVSPVREIRRKVAAVLPKLRKPRNNGPRGLVAALAGAGDMLRRAAGDEARVPGSQTVIVLTRGGDATRVRAATRQVHALTLQGAVTSVIDLAPSGGSWWSVASAGHGNFHRATQGVEKAVEAELDSLSRVIARLLRINVRLAKNVEAVRIIGSRVLGQDEVTRVKAREVATDRNLSKTLGLKADRGEDDDGVQTVIPYFYGGDAHVVLIELWVDKPGPVADVTLRYKDMVALDNATARASVRLSSLPRPPTPAQAAVSANVRGFGFASRLSDAAGAAGRGAGAVRAVLDQAGQLATGSDSSVVSAYRRAVDSGIAPQLLRESLLLASQRRIGHSAP